MSTSLQDPSLFFYKKHTSWVYNRCRSNNSNHQGVCSDDAREKAKSSIMLANKVMSIQRWFITYIFGYLAYQTTLQRASWIFPFQCTIPNSVSHQAIAQVTYHVFRNVWLWYLTQLLLYILKYTTQTYSILECQGSTMSYALMNTRK